MRGALDDLGAQLGPEHPAGSPALRNAIAGWLSTSRGLAVAPDQVILLSGRQQALHVAAHLALRRGARAVVEDPCDANAAAALAGEAAELIRVPVDADGLRTDCLPAGETWRWSMSRRSISARSAPSWSAAAGSPCSPGRRGSARWCWRRIARASCATATSNAPSLMSLDTDERVILLGGFCTSLGPWLGLAYLVLPRRLIARRAGGAADDRRQPAAVWRKRRWPSCSAAASMRATCTGWARPMPAGATRCWARCASISAPRRPTWGEHAGLHLAWFPPPRCRLARLPRGAGPALRAGGGRVAGRDARPAALQPGGAARVRRAAGAAARLAGRPVRRAGAGQQSSARRCRPTEAPRRSDSVRQRRLRPRPVMPAHAAIHGLSSRARQGRGWRRAPAIPAAYTGRRND